MKRVIIESPYAGDIAANLDYARLCLYDSLLRGEAPIASHLLHTQVLNDDLPEQRTLGLSAGHAWIEVCDLIAVYTDHGVSRGMAMAVVLAKRYGKEVDHRSILKPHRTLPSHREVNIIA